MSDAKGLSEAVRYEPGPFMNVLGGTYVKESDYAALAERLKACEARHKEYVYAVDIDQREAEKQCDQLTADLARVTAERDNLEAFVKKNAHLIADRDRLKAALVELSSRRRHKP